MAEILYRPRRGYSIRVTTIRNTPKLHPQFTIIGHFNFTQNGSIVTIHILHFPGLDMLFHKETQKETKYFPSLDNKWIVKQTNFFPGESLTSFVFACLVPVWSQVIEVSFYFRSGSLFLSEGRMGGREGGGRYWY